MVVLLNNTGGAPLDEMTRAIRGIMHGTSFDMPKKSVADALMAVIEDKGIDAGVAHFNSIKDAEGYNLSEGEMNNLGYALMGSGKVEEAAKVFQLNVEAFPKSFNTYDSLGESYMNLGENDLAITNYRKSVELNPNNQNGIDFLKQLGVDVSDLVPDDVKVSDAILETYIGKYELMPGFIIEIIKDGDQMKAQATGQPVADIFPRSNTEFYLKVVDAKLVFNKGENGEVASVTLHQGGQEKEGKKIE